MMVVPLDVRDERDSSLPAASAPIVPHSDSPGINQPETDRTGRSGSSHTYFKGSTQRHAGLALRGTHEASPCPAVVLHTALQRPPQAAAQPEAGMPDGCLLSLGKMLCMAVVIYLYSHERDCNLYLCLLPPLSQSYRIVASCDFQSEKREGTGT